MKQYSDARIALVQGALTRAAAIIVGRRRVLSGIRWHGDLIVTAAEAIGGAEHVDIRLEGDELGAEVIATDLTTDVAVLRLDLRGTNSASQASGSGRVAASGGTGTAASGGTGTAASGGTGTAASGGTGTATPGGTGTAASGGTGTAASGGTGTPASAGSGVARSGGTSPMTSGDAVVAASGDADIATSGGARPSALGESGLSSASLRVGETIVVVGRTLRGPAAMWGSVQLAGPAWSSRRGGRIDQRLELDLAFDPSFEGGAVIDMEGNVAAMLVPGPYHRVLGIPTTTIEGVVTKVSQFGRLPKPYIGIRLQRLWLDDHTRTRLGRKSRGIAAVGGVDAGSPAAEAHIELGDLLLTVDGEPAESVSGLAQRIAATNPGETITLEVLRGGKPLTINVQVGERPQH